MSHNLKLARWSLTSADRGLRLTTVLSTMDSDTRRYVIRCFADETIGV